MWHDKCNGMEKRQDGKTWKSGARLTKAYDVTIQRYRNSHAKNENSKMHILRCMGSKFSVKFQRCPLKFHTKFWTHTPQNMHFMRCKKFDHLWYLKSYDILSLSETAPRGSFNQHGLTLIPAWISNYIHYIRYKMWDEITYSFLNFNSCNVEV